MKQYKIEELEQLHQLTNIQTYCKSFIDLFQLSISILPEKVFYKQLSFQDSELFPESSQCFDAFNFGNLNFVINFIYHFKNSNKNWLFDSFVDLYLDENELFYELFYDNSNIFLFKKISFQLETLLSKNEWSNVLTYLFLFFLPCISNYDLLFHYQRKIPLLSCHEISNQNFDLILYLMQKFSPNEFKHFCQSEKNFLFLLIDDFICHNKQFYVINHVEDWKKHLPIYKINRLYDLSCSIKEFHVSPQFFYLYKDITAALFYIEKEYIYQKLNSSIKNNNLVYSLNKI